MIKGLRAILVAGLLAAVGTNSVSVAAEKREVVWDGFSFKAESAQTEKCSERVHPSCSYLFSDDYQTRFAVKLYGIDDDRHKFVSLASSDKGETLHLTITINFEWADILPKDSAATSKDTALAGRYRICSTLMLYSANATTYMIQNAASNCHTKALLSKDTDNLNVKPAFVADFITAIEKDWLAEASQIIARKPGMYKSINVANVDLASSFYPGDEFRRERLRLFIAEKMSEQLSYALGKPIIPPVLSGEGAMALAFGDPSRNRKIMLWPSAHALSIEVAPNQTRMLEDKSSGIQKEIFYSIVKITHETASKNRLLDGGGFYAATERKIIQQEKLSAEDQVSETIIKNQIPLENIERLLVKIAAQINNPDKKWIDGSAYKSDPKVMLNGFSLIRNALND